MRGMSVEPSKVRRLAVLKEDENWAFRAFLKAQSRLSDEEVDALVRTVTDRVWAGVDCTRCANCCKEIRPSLDQADVERLAGGLGMSGEELIAKYLEAIDDTETPWRMKGMPCVFLKENKCSVYEHRPAQCRGYPYLHKEGFVSRLMGVVDRTFTCPIVYEVMEELKGEMRWGRRRR